MATDLHDCEGVNPRSSHVRDRRMTEVMKVEIFNSGQLAGSRKAKDKGRFPVLSGSQWNCSAYEKHPPL
jgi:hypothetical protein